MYEPLIEEISTLRGAIANLEKKAMDKEGDSEDVYVKNLDEIEIYLRRELAKLGKLLKAPLDKIASKDGKSSNMIVPDSLEISNLKELTSAIGAFNTMLGVFGKKLQSANFSPEINVNVPDVIVPEIKLPNINVPEIKVPQINIPEVRITKDSILFDIDRLLEALKPLSKLSTSPKNPISVRLSDGQRFLEEVVATMKKGNEQLATVVSTSYGLTKQQFKDAMAEVGYNRTGYTATKALTDGTVAQLSATSVECKQVEISAVGGIIAVGFSTSVLATAGSEVGVLCYPGNLPYVIETDNLNRIYVAGANGRRVCYNYYV